MGVGRLLKYFSGFLKGREELVVSDGFQQKIQCIHLVAFKGILLEGCGEDDARLLGQTMRQLHTIDQITYVSGMKDYVMFYLDNEPKALITHLTMKAVEEMLPTELFMRVSRSYIVALQHIRKVDRNDCIYIGDEIIHVTDAYLPAFQDYIAQRMKHPNVS